MHSGRSGLSNSSPVLTASVLQRFTLRRMVAGSSSRLIRLPSLGSLLLILLVPSSSDITRAPSLTINAWTTHARQNSPNKKVMEPRAIYGATRLLDEPHCVRLDTNLRFSENAFFLRVLVVETSRDVARELEVLSLILAHRHEARLRVLPWVVRCKSESVFALRSFAIRPGKVECRQP